MKKKEIMVLVLVGLTAFFGVLTVYKVAEAQDPCGLFGGNATGSDADCDIDNIWSDNRLDVQVYHDYYEMSCSETSVYVRLEFVMPECDDNHIIIYSPMFLGFASRLDLDNEEIWFQVFCFDEACGKATFKCQHDTDGDDWWHTGGYDTVWCQ